MWNILILTMSIKMGMPKQLKKLYVFMKKMQVIVHTHYSRNYLFIGKKINLVVCARSITEAHGISDQPNTFCWSEIPCASVIDLAHTTKLIFLPINR